MSYFYVLATIALTVFGQIITKSRVNEAGPLPEGLSDKVLFIIGLLADPWIFCALFSAFIASMTWMAAMTQLQLSHAYPFMSLSFILVILFSALFLDEPLTTMKLVGIGFVILGLAIGSQD